MSADTDHLRALRARAYPGAWYIDENDGWWELYAEQIFDDVPPPFNIAHPLKIAKCPKRDQAFAEYWPRSEEGELIVAAVNNLVGLCDELDRVRAECEALRAELERKR